MALHQCEVFPPYIVSWQDIYFHSCSIGVDIFGKYAFSLSCQEVEGEIDTTQVGLAVKSVSLTVQTVN